MGDGSSCPNQAYASQWSIYNLVTGKPLLDTAFRNYHWGNTDSNSDGNITICDSNGVLRSSRMKLVECSEIEADSPWNDMLSTLESFQTYVELESYILSLEVEHTKPMKCSVQKFKGKKHKLDVIAEISKHTDSPQNHSPVLTLEMETVACAV